MTGWARVAALLLLAHVLAPYLALVVETGAHVIHVRAGLAAGTLMDHIRLSRWVLAPVWRVAAGKAGAR